MVLCQEKRSKFVRVVFMGTPEFAVPSLEALAAKHEVVLVLTRPDAVRSRGKKLEPSPVKVAAQAYDLEVLETSRITADVLEKLRAVQADVICVAAYGCILPDEVLHMAPGGCVNVHASLLPRWRGAAPIQRAILAGDEHTGVSIMRIGHGVDTGAYCAQASTSVAGKRADELTNELACMGAELLVNTLISVVDGSATWIEQDEELVTHAAKISKQELCLDPANTVLDNVRRVLASSNTAPARCEIAGKTVRVLDADETTEAALAVAEGTFVIHNKHLYLGCSDGALEVFTLKPDGKREMDASAWIAGMRETTGVWRSLAIPTS